MSIRSEASSTAAPTAGFSNLDMNGSAVGTAPTSMLAENHVAATVDAARAADCALGDANSLSTNHPDHPLKRTFVATIRANLGELCLRKTKGTWAPSADALRAMYQYAPHEHGPTPPTRSRPLCRAQPTHAPNPPPRRQRKFVDLSGSAESCGDLKSVVLHSMTLTSVKSDFDVRE